MCQPASFIVTRERVLFSKLGDSHELIITENKLDDSMRGGDFVRVEIVPPHGNYSLPLKKWIYNTDQHECPEWYNAKEAEIACRKEIKVWAKHHIVKSGEHECAAEQTLIALGNATVNVSGGEVFGHDDCVLNVSGGVVRGYCNCVLNVSGGTARGYGNCVLNVSGGEVWGVWQRPNK